VDDVKYFISIHSLPNLNVFTGENAAALFNDPRPLLLFFYDPDKGEEDAHTVATDSYRSQAKVLNEKFEEV